MLPIPWMKYVELDRWVQIKEAVYFGMHACKKNPFGEKRE